MKVPQEVLTKGRKGLEVRSLVSRGRYVLYEYRDPETLELVDKKQKLMLKDENGSVKEFFLIPLKDGRFLMFESKKAKEPVRKVWNPKTGKAEDLW